MTRVEKITGLSKKILTQIGIYKIWFRNDPKKKVYIGSAIGNGESAYKKGFLCRWNLHLSNLINNHNCTPKLQNAFNKYGVENIVFEIVDILQPNYNQRYYEIIETGYIAKYNSVNNGWNININGRNCMGTPMRKEVKDKIAIANSGKNNGMFGKFSNLNPNSKPIYQYNLNGEFIKKWNSARDIDRSLKIPYKQISQAFKTESKYCKGFLWLQEFKGEKIKKYIKYNPIKHIKKMNNI